MMKTYITVKQYKYKPYNLNVIPGVYSEAGIRNRNFSPKVNWKDSNMKKIIDKVEDEN